MVKYTLNHVNQVNKNIEIGNSNIFAEIFDFENRVNLTAELEPEFLAILSKSQVGSVKLVNLGVKQSTGVGI